MGTGITVLLAYAVYLTIMTEWLPDTSIQVCLFIRNCVVKSLYVGLHLKSHSRLISV